MKLIKIARAYLLQRKLSNRERNLLIFLGFTIIWWILFGFVIPNQINRILLLKNEKSIYEENMSRIKLMIKDEEDIHKELESLQAEKAILANKVFLNLDQSKVVEILSDILNEENVEIQDIIFSEPSQENIEELIVNKTGISIPYKGSYQGVLEILKSISTYPKKILVDSLIMDKDDNGLLSGTISLSLYNLSNVNQDVDEVDNLELSISNKSNPFESFQDYIEEDYKQTEEVYSEQIPQYTEEGTKLDNENKDEFNRILLEDFENGNFNFIPSSEHVKGNVVISNNSKSKNNSLRVEYDILAIEEENKAFIDLSDKKILIKYPPDSIGLWVNSYSYSPIKIGIRLKGQNNEEIDITLSKGISWIGWSYVKSQLPLDIDLYPLLIDKIYVELAYNREDYGVLIFDKLEANYPKDSNSSNEFYMFHIVEEGETLDNISLKYYNTTNKKNLIIKHNELKSEDIRPGKILIIPK